MWRAGRANETEPYILFKSVSSEYEVTESDFQSMAPEYKHNWMGEVRVSDKVIKGLKLDRRAGDTYSESSKLFYLFSEDVRGVVKATPLQRKRSARSKSKEVVIYEIDQHSLDKIKQLVYLPEPFVPKRARVPRDTA